MTHRKHKHFDLMQKYYGEFGRWRCYFIDIDDDQEKVETDTPFWDEDLIYELEEIRPMYQLNGVQYPAPETEPLEMGQTYYVADSNTVGRFVKSCWDDDGRDKGRLADGLIHLKKESAIQHATAMLAGKPVIKGEVMNTKERLHNLELAFMAYHTITQDMLPPEYSKAADKLMREWFNSSSNLGAFSISNLVDKPVEDRE